MNSSPPSQNALRFMYQEVVDDTSGRVSLANDEKPHPLSTRKQSPEHKHEKDMVEIFESKFQNNDDVSFEEFIYYLFVATDINPVRGIDTFDMEISIPRLSQLDRDVFEHIYYNDTDLPDTCENTALFLDRRVSNGYCVIIKTSQHLQDLISILTYIVESDEFNALVSDNAYFIRNYLYYRVAGLTQKEYMSLFSE